MTDTSQELIFVGIDVAKDSLEVAIDGQSRSQCFANDSAGIKALQKHLQQVDATAVLMEATGDLERDAAHTLCAAGFAVMVVNPRQAHDFGKALGILAKTDSIDAKALAAFARTLYGSSRRDALLLKLPSDQQQLLQELVTRRRQLVGMRTAEANRLGRARKRTARSVRAVIKALDKQIAALDDEIGGQLQGHFAHKLQLLEEFKGLGPNTKAVLMALVPELGSLNRREIAKLVGVAPLACDSGTMHGKRICWGGRAQVRSSLYMATLSAMRHNRVIRAFYKRLRAAGKLAKVAIVACMRKMLVIINAVLKSGVPYSDTYPQQNA